MAVPAAASLTRGITPRVTGAWPAILILEQEEKERNVHPAKIAPLASRLCSAGPFSASGSGPAASSIHPLGHAPAHGRLPHPVRRRSANLARRLENRLRTPLCRHLRRPLALESLDRQFRRQRQPPPHHRKLQRRIAPLVA